MSIDAEYLLSRLPAFYRERDAEQGGALQALLAVLAEQGDLLEDDIARLYDNWFIETCDEWLVPYIGDLLGVRGLHGIEGTRAFTQRALVANTLRLRRRKGTLPVLEELALDTTGWRARAVEFFQLLRTTQHLNHLRPDNLRTPNLRDAAGLERIDSAFDRAAHTLEVRPLSAGRYNIPNIGLYLWRLQAYALQRGSAAKVTIRDGLYTFDPLGRDLPLYNRPRSEDDVAHLAEPVNVPEPLSRRALYDELSAYRRSLATGAPDPRRYFAPGRDAPVIRVWLNGQPVPDRKLRVCNLSALPGVAPEDWRRPAADTVGFDPVLGRIALPTGANPASVEVAYAYGFPGDIGGGPYDRHPARRDAEADRGLFDPEDFDELIQVPTQQPTLAAALAAITSGKRWLIRIAGDGTEVLAPDLDLPDTYLAIEADNRRRPVLVGDLRFKGNPNSRLGVSGLWIDGQLKLAGALRGIDIRHCTLVPARGGISHTGGAPDLELVMTHAICGPISCSKAIALVVLNDCIVDAGGAKALDLPDTRLSLDRCNVFGTTEAGQLEASNSLFTGKLTVERRQQGCVRFCYVPGGSKTPRRYRCLPDMVVANLPTAKAKLEAMRVTPSFTTLTHGEAGYAQLRLSTAIEVRTGADDGAEMGVWNLLKQPQREANLRQALDEYLRFGLEAGVIYVT